MDIKLGVLAVMLYGFLIRQVTMNDDECIDSVALSREIKACCDIPNPIEMDHIQECVEKYKHLREDAASMFSCIYECHAMELGVMNESGFNKSKLLHLVNGIAASEVKAVVLDAIDQCAERTQEQVSSQDQSQFQCSPFALLLNECIVREVYAKCPDEHWADTEICSKIRTEDVKICE